MRVVILLQTIGWFSRNISFDRTRLNLQSLCSAAGKSGIAKFLNRPSNQMLKQEGLARDSLHRGEIDRCCRNKFMLKARAVWGPNKIPGIFYSALVFCGVSYTKKDFAMVWGGGGAGGGGGGWL